LSTIPANNVVLGNGTSAVQTVAPGSSGNVLTSNGTTWTSQAIPIRSGITTVTLTSSSPNATLTNVSNQFINITDDNTLRAGGSVTLPDMTTLTAGAGYFIFANNTIFNIALKDNGGTVREYIAPGANYIIDISSISTTTGVWQTALPSNSVNYDTNFTVPSFLALPYNSTYFVSCYAAVSLDSTHFAVVWVEYNGSARYIYAKLFTVNPSTKAITAGNQVTIGSASSMTIGVPGGGVYFDSDNAGHAFVAIHANGFNSGFYAGAYYFGLSVSGGTLYASSLSVISSGWTSDSGGCCVTGTYNTNLFCSYLGNNAYAFGFGLTGYAPSFASATYIRGATVTGTTTVTVTDSASNTSFTGTNSTAQSLFGSRTSLTGFTTAVNSSSSNNKAIAYNPASNTFSVSNRSSGTLLAIEQGATGTWASFAQGGFMFSSGHAVFGGTVYDITNDGIATVTGSVTTGYSFKYNQNAAYSTATYFPGFSNSPSSIYASGTSIVRVDTPNSPYRLQCDPSQTTLNMQKSAGANNYVNLSGVVSNSALMLSTNLAVLCNASTVGITYPYTSVKFNGLVVDVATPITV